MASEEQQVRAIISQVGAKPDDVKHIRHAFELYYFGHAGKGDGEGRARRTLANLKSILSRNGLDPQGAYYQPIDDRDSSKGGMIVILDSTFDKSRASRPGAKDVMGTNKRIIRARGHEFLAEDDGRFTRISIRIDGEWEHATTVNSDKQTAAEWIEANAQPGNPSRWLPHAFSRPGAKAKFAVEDRFYFGKERFADDAKQIADTILKQLGGGRFVAMTGAKNLSYASNPPGLHMSIGSGAKSGIKYLRVDYDRGSDTYTMKFLNRSGGSVRDVSHVHAGELRRVFTSTTGFETSL